MEECLQLRTVQRRKRDERIQANFAKQQQNVGNAFFKKTPEFFPARTKRFSSRSTRNEWQCIEWDNQLEPHQLLLLESK